MRQYVAKRLLLLIPVLFGISLITFTFMRVIPGDVVDAMFEEDPLPEEEALELKAELGLDRPLLVQYTEWVWGIVRLDAGVSMWTRKPVFDEIILRLPVTIELAVLSFVLQLVIAIPLGVLSAANQDKLTDQSARFFAILGIATPNFWLAILSIVFLAQIFGWIPPIGGVASPFREPGANVQQFFLPAIILGTSGSATLIRLTRNTMLEVIRQDYIRTAFAKGLKARRVWYSHALKNAMIPVVTSAGSHLGGLLGGTVLIENIFALPGVGQLTLDAIHHRDIPQLEITVLFLAVIYVMVNLVVDLSYAWLDPRIRYS